MALTQSGYAVIPGYGDPRLAKLIVNGVSIAPGVLAGPVHTVLEWVAARFDATVDRLVAGWCWGYGPREIRGGSGWSNHASGTAIDLNAPRFPQGARAMSPGQVTACRAIVAASGGVIRWGGDFGGGTAVDQQHFEIAPGMAGSAVAALARTIIQQPEDDMPYTEAQLRAIYRSEFLATLRSDEGREAVAIALLGYPRKRPDFWQMLNDIWRATTKGKP